MLGNIFKIIGSIALAYVLSYPAMLLWNDCLVPATTVVATVTWHQMWGIMCSIYFVAIMAEAN